MVRRSVLAMFAVMAIVLGGVVVSTPAGAVVDSAVVVPSPNPGTSYNVLNSVSCVSVSFCVATGYQYSGSADPTLVEQWNGSVWSTVTSPSPGTTNNSLYSVSCVSVSFCVATGIQYSGSSNQPLYETLVLSLTGPVPPTTTTTTTDDSGSVVPAFTG